MNTDKTQYLWVENFRPRTLDEYIGNEHMKERVKEFIDTSDVPHLLLYGPAGTGKTTLAKIIVNHIDCDVLYINASDENSVDTVRNKIRNFASTMGFKELKIVILDEADFITPQAQAALRNLMETFSATTRFILTCNYKEKMISPIVSRTQQFEIIPLSKAEVAKHLASILVLNDVAFDVGDVKLLVDSHYPDIRKIINEAQSNTYDKELKLDTKKTIESDYKLKILEILKSDVKVSEKFKSIRQVLADSRIRDFSDFYRLLYDKVTEYAPRSVSETILYIADGQYRDALVMDKEINAMATIINILKASSN